MTKDELNETNDEWLERVQEKYGDNITLEEFEKLSLVEQIEYSAPLLSNQMQHYCYSKDIPH